MLLAVSSVPRDSRMHFKERLPDQMARRLQIPIFYFRAKNLGFYYLDFLFGLIFNYLHFRKTAKNASKIICFVPQLLPFVLLTRKPTVFVAVDDYEGTIYRRKVKKLYFKFIKRFFVPKTRFVICTTNYIFQRYSNLISDSQLRLIRVGVDTTHFQPSSEPPTDPFVLYYQGKIRADYNTDMLIKTMKFLPDDVVLWLVGDGPQRNLLEQLVKNYGIQERVKFFGKKPYDELPKIIKRANVCLNPINLLGTKLYQYFASGKPVVSLCGMTQEIAQNEVHYLCTKKSPKAYAEAILRIKRNPELAMTLGRQARKNIMQQDWNTITALYKTVIRKI